MSAGKKSSWKGPIIGALLGAFFGGGIVGTNTKDLPPDDTTGRLAHLLGATFGGIVMGALIGLMFTAGSGNKPTKDAADKMNPPPPSPNR